MFKKLLSSGVRIHIPAYVHHDILHNDEFLPLQPDPPSKLLHVHYLLNPIL